uniref:V-SNARE coiled-coil homology domain-containing protein n=1 Tax=Leptobrachium leishanense TaxID=445787 RepID=A0A8C5M3R4_9ANUR
MAHWELCQKDAEEVKILMKNNVEKVFEREGKLSDLEERSNDLLSKVCFTLHLKVPCTPSFSHPLIVLHIPTARPNYSYSPQDIFHLCGHKEKECAYMCL